MKAKRLTKAQKEAQQKKALLQRVTDVYSGALGRQWSMDEFATADVLANVITALREMFGDQLEWTHVWESHCIDRFDTPETATEFLFGNGIRA